MLFHQKSLDPFTPAGYRTDTECMEYGDYVMKRGLILLAGISLAFTGCLTSKPDRTMRQPKIEEFAVPPPKYDQPVDLPRNEPILTPRQNTPGLNTNTPMLPGGPNTGGVPGRR